MEFKLSSAGSLSSASKAFAENEEKLIKLIGAEHPYFSIEKAINAKKSFPLLNRKVLVRELMSDYTRIVGESNIKPELRSNIELLNSENTYTICTGQQLHLFLGPAFVVYKILAIINTAADLNKKYPDKKFVPVYWLASEDHDFEEIRDTVLFNKKFVWQSNQTGACGRFHTKEVAGLIEEIRASFSLDQRSTDLLNAFSEIYRESANLADATIRVADMLFGSYGLICLNADKHSFKTLLKDGIKRDILQRANASAFERNSDELEKAGYSTQLHGREINYFYLNAAGRNRIVSENNIYKVVNTEISFTESEIIDEIENFPENFSPNAMLRPLYQETILPNISYFGGNAEVNYWLQIHNLFNINNINAPNLSLRPSVWIIPPRIMGWLQKHDIDPVKMLITSNSENLLSFLNDESTGLSDKIGFFNKLKKEVQDIVAQNISKELPALLEAGKTYEKLLKHLDKQLILIEKEKHSESYSKLKEIYSNYFDIKQIQERILNTLELLIKHDNVVFTLKNDLELKAGSGYLISL